MPTRSGDDGPSRDYGLPDPEAVLGTPTWEPTGSDGSITAIPIACPNCGAKLCHVSVDVEMSMLKGGKGRSNYLGCPACPYASPAVVVAHGGK